MPNTPFHEPSSIGTWDIATSQVNKSIVFDLAYTVPLTRNGVSVSSKEDQKHPAAGLISNDGQASNTLVGQLNPGVIIADVPVTVVVQNGTPSLTPTIRSQDGTTTTGIVTQDDETLSLGWTPALIKAEITEGTDGIIYRREVDRGKESWVVA